MACGLSLYYFILPEQQRREVFNTLMRLPDFKTTEQLSGVFGWISSNAKIGGLKFSQNWRYYVDLFNLYGYEFRDMSDDELDRNIHLLIDSKDEYSIDSYDWADLFRKSLDKIFSSHTSGFYESWMKEYRPYKFLSDYDRWTTGGATHLPIIKGLTKVKNALPYSYTLGQLYNVMYYSDITKNRAVEKKDEIGKRRIIVTANDAMYLNMSYVSVFLDQLMGKTKDIVYTYSSGDILTMWMQFKSMIDSVNVPFDQSAFDQQKSMQYVLLMLDSIDKFLDRYDLPTEVKSSINRIRNGHKKASAVWASGKKKSKVYGGILSGWRWTTLYDCLGNWADIDVVRVIMADLGYSGIYKQEAMGDDAGLIFSTMNVVIAFLNIVKMLGIKFNIKKFFVDEGRNEFLRKVVTKDGYTGYPTRGLAKIIWRSPVRPKDSDIGPNAIADAWSSVMRRGTDLSKCIKHMIRDISGAIRLSGDKIYEWLMTLRELNGGGLGAKVEGLGLTHTFDEVVPSAYRKDAVAMNVKIPGLRSSDHISHYNQTFSKKSNFKYSLINKEGCAILIRGGCSLPPKYTG